MNKYFSNKWAIFIFATPALILFTAFCIYPIIPEIGMSFQQHDGFRSEGFVGLNNFKEIIISLLGLTAPFIITAGLYYVLGKDIGILLADIRDNLLEKTTGFHFTRLTIILLIYTGLIIIVSTGFLIMRMNSKKIKSRKTFSLLLWSLVISVTIFFLVPSVSVEIVWIAGIPACYLLAHYFVFERKKVFAEIVFTLFFLLVLLIQALNIF